MTLVPGGVCSSERCEVEGVALDLLVRPLVSSSVSEILKNRGQTKESLLKRKALYNCQGILTEEEGSV